MIRLSIVIVTYNSRGEIDACLGSLARHPPSCGYEIALIDNASGDGTPSAVREQWPSVRVIDAGGNVGFARANNIGFGQTTGELVLLLNPDTEVTAGALDRLIAVLDARADAAVAGPRLVSRDGRAELSFGAMPGPLTELRQKILVRGSGRRLPLVSAYVERVTQRPREVDWVSGACLIVRRADAEAVGRLDEQYFMYMEDVDFCASIRGRGRKILFTPAAEIVHLRGRSVVSLRDATAQAYRRSQLAFYQKHRPRWVPALRTYLKLRGVMPDIRDVPTPAVR